MSDEKKYTEREVVLREREAFLRGANNHRECADLCVKTCYPLPKVTRPRVVRDPHANHNTMEWRVTDDGMNVEWRDRSNAAWRTRLAGDNDQYWPLITPERVRVWIDLFENPTELVEDDS